MPRRRKPSIVHRKLKLSAHENTGKRIGHHHTSYGLLVCLMLFTGFLLSYATKTEALAAKVSPGFSVSAVVPATPENSGQQGTAQANGSQPKASNQNYGSASANLFSWSIQDIWTFFLIIFLALTLFWLGERYQLEKLRPSLWKTSKRKRSFAR